MNWVVMEIWHSQKQCNYFLCQHNADKTIVNFLRNQCFVFKEKLLTEQYWWFVKDGFLSGWVMRWELLKKLSWNKPQARWVERLFYINDIIASLQKPKKQYKSFVMNYNTQLCNTAWGKKLLAQVAKRTCF